MSNSNSYIDKRSNQVFPLHFLFLQLLVLLRQLLVSLENPLLDWLELQKEFEDVLLSCDQITLLIGSYKAN